jgi:cysteine desulfurase
MEKYIYFDNNATTIVPDTVIASICKWYNMGNPSSNNVLGNKSTNLIESAKAAVAEYFGFSLKDYYVIFNSGASESNSYVITNAARSFKVETGKLPIIMHSNVEHKSVMHCIELLTADSLIAALPIYVNFDTGINLVKFEDMLKKNVSRVALIVVMYVNNETGIINNIKKIVEIAHKYNKPVHSDCVQAAGKIPLNISALGIDSVAISMHKMHGPIGTGICIIRKELVKNYGMCAEICGSQNFKLRGGTENIPGIAGALASIKYMLRDPILKKAADIVNNRNHIVIGLSKLFPCFYICDYGTSKSIAAKRSGVVIYWLTNKEFSNVVTNTILLSVYKPKVCNQTLMAELEAEGIIVSTGSACNASETDGSTVVKNMQVPEELHNGVLRISLGIETTKSDASVFVKVFSKILGSI